MTTMSGSGLRVPSLVSAHTQGAGQGLSMNEEFNVVTDELDALEVACQATRLRGRDRDAASCEDG